ncbi:MAG: DUF2461 domain-containing protein [Dermatophilaceae bacterium]
MAFTGFPPEAITFYAGLEQDNSRDYWQAHKQTYAAAVRGPLEALLDDLADEFGEAKVFRPNRDVRFSADKSPYKDHQGAIVGRDTTLGLYLGISADGLVAGGGFRAASSDLTRRFRAAVDAPESGLSLVAIMAGLEGAGFAPHGEQVATAPRGFAKDHPRIALLRRKELFLMRDFGVPPWLSTPRTRDEVAAVWRTLTPLRAWLQDHVAP